VIAVAAVDAVVFDLDDTLVDWRTSVHRAASEVGGDDLADQLLAWGEEHVWVRREGIVVLRNTWQLAEFAERTWPLALPELDDDEVALLVKRFRSELWVSFFRDTVPTLDQLVDTHRLALLSNNPYLAVEVRRLRLDDWFEVAIDLPRGETKPDPRAFARALAVLETTASRTMYVGDSILADAEGAQAAGWRAVWLDRYDDGWVPPAGVDRITSLTELPDLLASVAT
jgi:putative hydrolase of the HAD superfamily